MKTRCTFCGLILVVQGEFQNWNAIEGPGVSGKAMNKDLSAGYVRASWRKLLLTGLAAGSESLVQS